MSIIEQLPFIPAADILQPSSRFPVVLENPGTPGYGPHLFSSDEEAVRFKTENYPDMSGKVELPLELPMEAVFRLENPESKDRPVKDFRIVLPDREVVPANERECTVMPYVLYNQIVSLVLKVVETRDEGPFDHNSFWLNVLEPGMHQPFRGVTDAYFQIMLNGTERPADEVVERYLALREKAGHVLERLINHRIATT